MFLFYHNTYIPCMFSPSLAIVLPKGGYHPYTSFHDAVLKRLNSPGKDLGNPYPNLCGHFEKWNDRNPSPGVR